ncbi:MAG: sodium/alanine symporter protein [Rickettsiales bacterium]|nr:sodium/alanine symporter protein [Rickettsiales bacterium]|tara:strand:+ start:22693 stop:24033 length:1341 start_codon:yes stop_codon:yes gene_type:complete
MIEQIFSGLDTFNTLLWGYLGTAFILIVGLFLSFRCNWYQITNFPEIVKEFVRSFSKVERQLEKKLALDSPGISSLRAFFASIGGCIGVGNLVTISMAIKIGGPGALLWIWVVALLGMIIKYTEVYLGIKYRVQNGKIYQGGPMYIIQKAFPNLSVLASIVALLMAIYGVEIFMFSVVKQTLTNNFDLSGHWVTFGLVLAVFWGVYGGVNRIGAISSFLIPCFVIVFMLMTLWILIGSIHEVPHLLKTIFYSAFNGHAAIGGFAGSSFLMVLAKGFSSAAYSGDVGIGYASMMQAETRDKSPRRQANLTIFGIFLDTFIVCTCTVLLITLTGVWTENISGEQMVQVALSRHFPLMDYFMPIFLFALGYSTLLPYLCAGLKSAQYVMPKYGPLLYYGYALVAFVFFSFFDASYALIIMNIAGGLLMMINIPVFFCLRREVAYDKISK